MNELLKRYNIELEQDEQLIYARSTRYVPPTPKDLLERNDAANRIAKILEERKNPRSNLNYKFNNIPEFLIITDRRIMMPTVTHYWDKILEIRKGRPTILYLKTPTHLTKELPDLRSSVYYDFHPNTIRFISNDEQDSQIMKAWRLHGPLGKINAINEKVIGKFNLKETSVGGDRISYTGLYSFCKVSYFCSGPTPFTGISLTFSFPEPSASSLVIDHESVSTGLKGMLGFKDIQAGNKQFDDAYLVKSNQPEKLKQLLSHEVIAKFNQLYTLGKCTWSYQPPSTTRFKATQQHVRDDESVLDAPELLLGESTEGQDTNQLISDLVVSGELSKDFSYDYDQIEQFIQRTFELTELLVNDFLLEQSND